MPITCKKSHIMWFVQLQHVFGDSLPHIIPQLEIFEAGWGGEKVPGVPTRTTFPLNFLCHLQICMAAGAFFVELHSLQLYLGIITHETPFLLKWMQFLQAHEAQNFVLFLHMLLQFEVISWRFVKFINCTVITIKLLWAICRYVFISITSWLVENFVQTTSFAVPEREQGSTNPPASLRKLTPRSPPRRLREVRQKLTVDDRRGSRIEFVRVGWRPVDKLVLLCDSQLKSAIFVLSLSNTICCKINLNQKKTKKPTVYSKIPIRIWGQLCFT